MRQHYKKFLTKFADPVDYSATIEPSDGLLFLRLQGRFRTFAKLYVVQGPRVAESRIPDLA